jgi:cell division transport system ATP-binding protein
MTTGNAISVSNASIYQREQLVLTDVNFNIADGEFVYLVGKVGSGKSSLIKTLNAEIPLINGQIEVAGYNLGTIKKREVPFLRRKLGVVFQDFKLLTDRSVYDNLAFVLKATGWKTNKTIDARIREMLKEVDMVKSMKKMPHQLSGGEQQRIVIARALLNDPQILLADEPTGNLDAETSAQIMFLFRKINSEGKTIVMATHDQMMIEQFPYRILICDNGKVIVPGASTEKIDFNTI